MSQGWSGGSTTRWRKLRAYVLQRDGYVCRVRLPGCTKVAGLAGGHVDHIVPLSMGGDKWDPLNCRASCRHCNLKRAQEQVKAMKEEPEPRRITKW